MGVIHLVKGIRLSVRRGYSRRPPLYTKVLTNIRDATLLFDPVLETNFVTMYSMSTVLSFCVAESH